MKRTTAVLLVSLFPMMAMAQDFGTQISERQVAFSGIELGLENADDLIDGHDTDWIMLSATGQTLKEHSKILQASFPSGSLVGSKANSDVWDKPEKFNALMAQMNEGFEMLYTASQQQDAALAERGIKQAQDTCRSCHRAYRSRW